MSVSFDSSGKDFTVALPLSAHWPSSFCGCASVVAPTLMSHSSGGGVVALNLTVLRGGRGQGSASSLKEILLTLSGLRVGLDRIGFWKGWNTLHNLCPYLQSGQVDSWVSLQMLVRLSWPIFHIVYDGHSVWWTQTQIFLASDSDSIQSERISNMFWGDFRTHCFHIVSEWLSWKSGSVWSSVIYTMSTPDATAWGRLH